MNSLSWLLYLANLVSNLSIVSAVALGLALLTFLVSLVMWMAATTEMVDSTAQASSRFMRVSLIVATISSIVLILTPSRQTILLIAASEVGARVASSDAMQNMVDPSLELLRLWIEQQTQEIRRNLNDSNGR
jgi:hypothetical protein